MCVCNTMSYRTCIHMKYTDTYHTIPYHIIPYHAHIILHYISLHCITLHYTTLHHITSHHKHYIDSFQVRITHILYIRHTPHITCITYIPCIHTHSNTHRSKRVLLHIEINRNTLRCVSKYTAHRNSQRYT